MCVPLMWKATTFPETKQQINAHVSLVRGFQGGTNGKEPACQCRKLRDAGLIPGLGRSPWRRAWQPTPVFLPGESHGQRSPAGYSPWGCKD